MKTVAVRALLVGDEQLGTDDDAVVMSRCAQRLANAGAKTNEAVTLDLEGLTYNCDGTVRVRNAYSFTWGTKSLGEIRTVTETGPYPLFNGARERANLVFEDSQEIYVAPGMTIRGAHPDTGPARSPSIVNPATGKTVRNVFEQQCNIWVKNCGYFKACAVNLLNPWGDFVDFGTTTIWDIDQITQKAMLVPGKWDRAGRVGVHALCNNLLLQGGSESYVARIPSSFYHVEFQSDYAKAGVRNHRVQGLYVKDVGGFCDFSGAHIGEDIALTNNMSDTGPIDCKFVPYRGTRLKGVVVMNNGWTDPGTGGKLLNAWNIDHLTYKFNAGPIRDQDTVAKLVSINGCTEVDRDPNNFARESAWTP